MSTINPITPLVASLSNEFQSFAKKSADAVLGMAETALKAKNLEPHEFANFCEVVGIERDSARMRKLLVIGKHAKKLRTHIDSLPPNWTTIYAISHLDEEQIEQLVRDGNLTPSTKAAQLPTTKSATKALVPNGTSNNIALKSAREEAGERQAVICFRSALDRTKAPVLKKACDLLREIGAEIQLGTYLEDLIADEDGEKSSVPGEETIHALA